MNQITSQGKASTLLQVALCYQLVDALQRGTAYRPQTIINFRKDDYIRSAIYFIESNYHLPINAQDIADYCKLNKNYLSRLFKDATNRTLIDFLIDYRLRKAQDYLRSTDYSIGEIAQWVGYNNQLHFSHAFSDHFGESPSRWRKLHQVVASD